MPERTTTSTLNVPVDKLLEDAEETGHLHLAGRKISIFPPTASNFDLADVIEMDLSENRFVELPELTAHMASLERLNCYNNVLRTIPNLHGLHALVHLDLSRNHIAELPEHVWTLPLRTLNISHNRLGELPEEMSDLSTLMDLDASGNEIQSLPESIGHLINLRDLNVRRNHLSELPESLTSLKLVRLDISVNRVSQLPLSMIKMTSLMTLILHDNPLVLPPTSICIRGRIHIFKYLKEELDRANGKIDVPRGFSKRDSRTSRNRMSREIKTTSAIRDGGGHRPSRTLEEEVASVANRHGMKWSNSQAAGPPDSHIAPPRPKSPVASSPTTPHVADAGPRKLPVVHNYAVLEPLALDANGTNGDADEATPTSSPVLERREPLPKPIPSPSTAAPATSMSKVSSAPTAASAKSTTSVKSTKGHSASVSRSSSSASSKGAKVSPKVSSASSHSLARPVSAASRSSASPGTRRPSATTSSSTKTTGTLTTSTAGGKSSTSPRIAPKSAGTAKSTGTTRPGASPKVSRPGTAGAKTSGVSPPTDKKPASTSSRPSTTSAQRTTAGAKKPAAAAKPSPQEVSAKVTTKKRLEKEWFAQRELEEKRAKEKKEALVRDREKREREVVEQNRMKVHRMSASDPDKEQSKSATLRGSAAAVDAEQQEKERQEREDLMAAADASRQKWKKQEKDTSSSTGITRSDGAVGSRDSVFSIASTDGDGVLSGSPSESSSPKTLPKSSSGGFRRSRPSSGSSGGSGEEKPVRRSSHFTVRRVEREAKREFDTLENIRKLIESVTNTLLPDDLAEALSDGVILCSLVNQLRPGTITIIYPAHRARGGSEGEKLSMLKCVKNVDSFIIGCKKLGLDTGLVCSPADILEMKDALHVYITVRALVNQFSHTQEVFNV